MAEALKQCIVEPKLIKPKCVWMVVVFLKNCKQTAEKWKQIFENWKKITASETHFGFTNFGSTMCHLLLTIFEHPGYCNMPFNCYQHDLTALCSNLIS